MAGLRRLLPHGAPRARPLSGFPRDRRKGRLPVARIAAALLAVLLAIGGGADARAGNTAGDFDFYVLSLSWSPSYCAAAGDRADPDQCSSGRPFAFVAHGLWPQYTRGYPEHCAADYRGPDRDLIASMLDIMPSRSLIRHEWYKHGTCAGLSPRRYFATTRRAFEAVVIPPRLKRLEKPIIVDPQVLEKAFIAVNEGMPADAIAVTCNGNRIREVRICLTRDLSGYHACPQIDRAACRRQNQRMPPVRRY
jgi:ribonuclease T2